MAFYSFARQRRFLLLALCIGLVLQCVVSASPIADTNPQDAVDNVDPAGGKPKKCQYTGGKKLKRKAWHTLSNKEKKNYIDAELCLMWQKPKRSSHPAAVSLFDDLQGNHQVQALRVHVTGWFLAWHRYMMWAHEKLLREECGYKGAQPYWDESPEAGNFKDSVVFDPNTGFGGDGTGPGSVSWVFDFPGIPTLNVTAKCISTGPFANYTLRIGPGFVNTPHCISRAVNETESSLVAASEVQACYVYDNFAQAWPCMEFNPHNGGHGGVNGEMFNPASSPGDPTFYLHHTWLDKVWWDWQKMNVTARKKDIAGNTSVLPITLPDGTLGYEEAKLTDVLNMGGIVQDVTLEQAVDLEDGLMECIEYVNPPPRMG